MENKERILDKAHDLFMRYGIKSITMDEIAGQLGISKKTIYHFFTDKDEMVEAIVNDEICKNEDECRRFKLASDNAVHELFIAADHMEEIMKTMNPQLMYDMEKHHPACFKKFRLHKNDFMYGMMKQNLERGIREEVYRPDINIELVARHRIESAFMAFNQDVFPAPKYSLGNTCYELIILFLHSVCTQKGKKLIDKYLIERNKKAHHEQKII